jgi:hypothetical protein
VAATDALVVCRLYALGGGPLAMFVWWT